MFNKLPKAINPDYPYKIVTAKGVVLRDEVGNEIIDLSSQNFNLVFGHSHPVIVAACKEQLDYYTYIMKDFKSEAQLKAIEYLSQLLPPYFNKYNLRLNNASDAIEAAIKMARRHTGKKKILTCLGGYFGQSHQTIWLRGMEPRNQDILSSKREDVIFGPMPYVIGQDNETPEDPEPMLALIEKHQNQLACVLLDTMLIGAGIFAGLRYNDYLRTIIDHCHKYNIPVILDECQSYGWVPDFLLSNYWKLDVDMIILGKGIANGFPIAVCAFNDKYDNLLPSEAEFTHGGTILSLIALTETAKLLLDKKEEEHFKLLTNSLSDILKDLCLRNNIRCRGIGLVRGLEISNRGLPQDCILAKKISASALKEGLYIRNRLNTLVLKPARVFTVKQLRMVILKLFDIILNELNNQSKGIKDFKC